MISIHNDGPAIVSTDYWQTEHAQRGLMYLSVNAGAVRLLAPRGWPDLQAPGVRGASLQLVGAQRVGVGHIVLEDGSQSPAYVTIDARQCDRALPAADVGRRVRLLVYGPGDTSDGVTLLAGLQARIDVAREQPQ